MNARCDIVPRLSVIQMVTLFAVFNLVIAFGLNSPSALARDVAPPLKIVAFGDSLTAGYGLNPQDAFPVQLARALKNKGYTVDVINAGVSGDTTGAGLARLDWVIPDDTKAVILELGANDALRGQDPKLTRKNLDAILTKLGKKNIDVLIAGMVAPRGLGPKYAQAFDPIFKQLSEKHGQLYYPFFLDGVAIDPKLNLPDGLHPNAKGIAVIVERILPFVEKLIDRVEARVAKSN